MNPSCLGLILFKKAHSATELEHKAYVYDINLSVNCLRCLIDPSIFFIPDFMYCHSQANLANKSLFSAI